MLYRLVKRKTKDGLVEIEDTTPLGREYDIDPATIRTAVFDNAGVIHKKRIGDVIGTNTYFFMDLLERKDKGHGQHQD